MTLPQETIDRIKADAERRYKGKPDSYFPTNHKYVEGHIAGATEWAGKAHPVIDAAEKVAKIFAHAGDHQTCAICQLARALQQWKDGNGKEVING